MKRRSLISLATLLLLTLSLGGCGESSDSSISSPSSSTPTSEKESTSTSSSTPTSSEDSTSSSSEDSTPDELEGLTSFQISNKEELQQEFRVGDADRTMAFMTNKELNFTNLINEGLLKITSSDSTVAKVIGIKITAKKAGTTTITATLGSFTDTVEITVLAKVSLKEKYSINHEGTQEDPLDNEDALIVAEKVGETPSEEVYIKDTIESFTEFPTEKYATASFFLTPKEEGGDAFLIYRAGLVGDTLTEDKIYPGAEVLVKATIYTFVNPKNSQYTTKETKSAQIVSIDGTPTTAQTIETDVSGALEALKSLRGSAVSYDHYSVTGYVVKVAEGSKGTNLFLSDTKGEQANPDKANTLEIYQYNGDNVSSLTVNSKIKVLSRFTNYWGTYETKNIESVTLIEAGTSDEGMSYVETPVVSTDYVAGTYQGTLKQNLFLNGAFDSSGYRLSLDAYYVAPKVQLEAVEGSTDSYHMKITSGAKAGKYLDITWDGSHANPVFEDTASTAYTYDTTAHSLTANVNNTDYYFATYNNYSTFSVTKKDMVYKNGALNTSEYLLHLYKAEYADPTAFTLESEIALQTGETHTLTYSAMEPYNADLSKITYTSSDTSIATVDAAGVVTALEEGTTTITATFGSITSTAQVTVTSSVNYGTQEAPLSVTDALALVKSEAKTSGSFTKKPITFTGKLTITPNYNSQYKNYDEFALTDGTSTLGVARAIKDSSVTEMYQNDTLIVSGYGEYYSSNYKLWPNGSTKPTILARTVGQSTATFKADTGFTVTDITGLDENKKADNGTEVTFKVTAADSKTPKVACNGTALTADDSGIYKFTLKGDASVSIKDSTAATNYGTQDAPLTVTEANDLILAETGKTNKKFTKKSIFVKGTLTTDNGYNSKYKNYTFTISDGSKTLKIQRAVLGSGVSSIKKGDTVILSGYGEYYNGCCMYPNGSTKPTVVAIVTA